MVWFSAKARPRNSLGTSSERYASIVTSSTPTPMPERKRHKFNPSTSLWNAIITLAAEYHNSENVKIVRRPKRSATKPKSAVPTKSPKNRAATKLATPVVPNRPRVEEVRIPLRTKPGAM